MTHAVITSRRRPAGEHIDPRHVRRRATTTTMRPPPPLPPGTLPRRNLITAAAAGGSMVPLVPANEVDACRAGGFRATRGCNPFSLARWIAEGGPVSRAGRIADLFMRRVR